MSNTFKIIDYIKVHEESILIDNMLYPRYFIHEGKHVGIPRGITFYRKNQSTKYIRLSSTDKVSGMSIRYDSKESQVQAILKLIKIKNMQGDTRPTVNFRLDEVRERKVEQNKDLPPGVYVGVRRIGSNDYNRVIARVFNQATLGFKSVFLHAGKVGDQDKLQEAINKAMAMRSASMELAASLTQVNAPKVV
jgi:hypothetical protein